MYYRFKCGDEIIRAYVWNDDYHTTVTVTDNETRKTYERTLRDSEKGKFFTWNKKKIYLENWIRITMKELKEKIDRKEWVTPDDLCQAILTDGIENVRFIAPFNIACGSGLFVHADKFKDTVCKVEERWNREVKQNYKIVLVPVKPDDSIGCSVDYYTSDMLSLIEDGHIKILLPKKVSNYK